MRTFDIKSMLYTLFPDIKIDNESQKFMQIFLNTYRDTIKKIAYGKKLNDITKAFKKITPKVYQINTIQSANDVLLNEKNTKENGNIFLQTAVTHIGYEVLNSISNCAIDMKVKKIYKSCIILAFAYDKDLRQLSDNIKILIPYQLSTEQISKDPRTKKQLIKELKKQGYKGIDNFDREYLLLLMAPLRDADETHRQPSKLIKFYTNLYGVNNKKNYYFDDIMKWDDYKLEVSYDFIEWLFPNNSDHVNPKSPELTKFDIQQFRTNPILRNRVVQATLRMLLFYGFVLDKKEIVNQVKPLNRRERGRTIGLFSTHNYGRITRIMDFLVNIKMEYLSAIFFLAICRALKSNYILAKKVLNNNFLKEWMSTQTFLLSKVQTYDINNLIKGVEIPDKKDEGYSDESEWEEVPLWLLKDNEDEEYSELEEVPLWLLKDRKEEIVTKKLSTLEKGCRNIKGLNYTGNSCYMDSALLCIFAIPNKTITDNILNKDLTMLKTLDRRLWSNCHNNIDTDIKRRQDIQKTLNKITRSMRGLNDVKKCTMLRSLIKKCPGSQPFHGTDTQDSGEFLAYLFNLFQVDVAKTSRKSYGSNDLGKDPNWVLVGEQNDNYASPIIDVVSTTIKNLKKDYNITKFVKQKQDSILDESDLWIPDKEKPDITYSRRKEVIKMKESPIVIFNLIRTYGKVIFSKPKTKKEKKEGKGKFKGIRKRNTWKRISAPEEMILKDKKLNLTAIVVHTGGAHYVANFKCQGEWFWYDDNPGSSAHVIKHIGSYTNMLKTSPNPLTHGTIFFYT